MQTNILNKIIVKGNGAIEALKSKYAADLSSGDFSLDLNKIIPIPPDGLDSIRSFFGRAVPLNEPQWKLCNWGQLESILAAHWGKHSISFITSNPISESGILSSMAKQNPQYEFVLVWSDKEGFHSGYEVYRKGLHKFCDYEPSASFDSSIAAALWGTDNSAPVGDAEIKVLVAKSHTEILKMQGTPTLHDYFNLGTRLKAISDIHSLGVNKALIRIIGLDEAILFAELISAFQRTLVKGKGRLGSSFYLPVSRVQYDTGLNAARQLKASKTLESYGLIKRYVGGYPKCRVFEIIFAGLNKLEADIKKDDDNFKAWIKDASARHAVTMAKINADKDQWLAKRRAERLKENAVKNPLVAQPPTNVDTNFDNLPF